MVNPDVQLKNYRDQLFRDVVGLLDARLKLIRGFAESSNQIVWQAPFSGMSHTIYWGLIDSIIVTLHWLFSKSPSDKRSLRWYLEQVRSNTKRFSNAELDAQIKQLDDLDAEFAKIDALRNRWISHRDPNAFNDPNSFLKENAISVEEVENLVNTAKSILEEHSKRFDEAFPIFDAPITGIEGLSECIVSRNQIFEFKKRAFMSRSDEEIANIALEVFGFVKRL